uniref:Uncharacterized protein n=1 Tax=Oryza barthii TaxID=65489 RepID=A0A0D3EQ84_9ORYZ
MFCCFYFSEGCAAVSSSTHRVKTATEKAKYLGVFLLLWSLSKRGVLLPPTTEDLDFVGYIKSVATHLISQAKYRYPLNSKGIFAHEGSS